MKVQQICLNDHDRGDEDLDLLWDATFNSDLILIRGCSGSGKTTLARRIKSWDADHVHLETDSYFCDNPDGVYRFKPEDLGKAHAWCQNRAYKALEACRRVIVSNTFTREFEIQPYLNMALALQLRVVIIDMITQYENVHGVPLETIERQKWRFVPVDCLKCQFPNIVRSFKVMP